MNALWARVAMTEFSNQSMFGASLFAPPAKVHPGVRVLMHEERAAVRRRTSSPGTLTVGLRQARHDAGGMACVGEPMRGHTAASTPSNDPIAIAGTRFPVSSRAKGSADRPQASRRNPPARRSSSPSRTMSGVGAEALAHREDAGQEQGTIDRRQLAGHSRAPVRMLTK